MCRKRDGLVPTLEYVAAGRLMDVETEEPLLDGDTPITAQTTFTPYQFNLHTHVFYPILQVLSFQREK